MGVCGGLTVLPIYLQGLLGLGVLLNGFVVMCAWSIALACTKYRGVGMKN